MGMLLPMKPSMLAVCLVSVLALGGARADVRPPAQAPAKEKAAAKQPGKAAPAPSQEGSRDPASLARRDPAIEAQLKRFTHTCYQVVPYESYIALAEKLNALTPGAHAKKTALFSTGAEAIENAIKIARAHTGRSGTIAFKGGFHGRTMMGMALTGNEISCLML